MAQKKNQESRIIKKSPARKNFLQKIIAFFVKTGKKLKTFASNLKAELKRVVWPVRKKLIQSTATVLAICLIIGIALFFIDSVLGGILNSVGFYSQTPTTNTTTQTTVAPTDATTTLAETSETTAD